jgi:hypothetical protein
MIVLIFDTRILSYVGFKNGVIIWRGCLGSVQQLGSLIAPKLAVNHPDFAPLTGNPHAGHIDRLRTSF